MTKIWPSLYKAGERLTKYQSQELMKMFQANVYPGKEEICQAAISLSTTYARIKCWLREMRKKKRARGALLEGE